MSTEGGMNCKALAAENCLGDFCLVMLYIIFFNIYTIYYSDNTLVLICISINIDVYCINIIYLL